MAVTELFKKDEVAEDTGLQLNDAGRLRHLLTLRGMSKTQLTDLLDRMKFDI